MTARRIPLRETQQTLTKIWGAGVAILFALLFAQTVTGTYGDAVEKAWAWLFPNVLPTFSLCVGSLVYSKGRQRSTSAFLGSLAKQASAAYLGILLATLLVQPFTGHSPAEWVGMSGVWLGPLQGALTAALGIFLTDKSDD